MLDRMSTPRKPRPEPQVRRNNRRKRAKRKKTQALGICINGCGAIADINPRTGEHYARCAECRGYQSMMAREHNKALSKTKKCLDCPKMVYATAERCKSCAVRSVRAANRFAA